MVAVVALAMVLLVTFAWFRNYMQVDYLEIRVKSSVKATATFWKLSTMTYSELLDGKVSEAQLDLDTRGYIQLTAATPDTQATLAPGRGDYFKIQIDITSTNYAYMKVELLDIVWTDAVPEEDRPAMEEYILVSSFQPTKPTVTQKLFVDSTVAAGRRDLTLCENTVVNGAARNKFYYYFILDTRFSSSIAGQLFSVKHVRVTLT